MSREKTNLTCWDYIENNLFSVCKAIQQSNGYNLDVREVVGWGTMDFPFTGVWPAVGIVIGLESANDIFGTNMRRCRRDVGMALFVQAPPHQKPGEPTSSRRYQEIIADLEKAVMADHTRGGYAEDTEIMDRQPYAEPTGLIGGFMRLSIIYRHQVGDLYTKL